MRAERQSAAEAGAVRVALDGAAPARLAVERLSKRYGTRVALDGVTLGIAPGEMVAVLGPSGAGKSTLLRCIARLTEPDAGHIRIDGQAIDGLGRRELAQARRDIGLVFQQFNLIGRRSALDNVLTGRLGAMPLWRVLTRRFAEDDVARAHAALAAVGLTRHAGQRGDTLSGGQQQRTAIARALAQESRVLLADEPVASLDPDNASAILDLLRRLAHERGLAVLATLHQPDLAHRYADRIVEMRDGRIADA